MNRRHSRSRGYSLSELLTIVAIVGLITMVAVPAFMQLLPQYRMRSAASEVASSLRMLRARAISLRASTQMIVDASGDSYRMRVNGVLVGENGRPVPGGVSPDKVLTSVNITTGGTVEFLRDGTATSDQQIILETTNRFVAYNRYTIQVTTAGAVTITPSKV